MVNIVILCWNALEWTKHTVISLMKSLELCSYKYQITIVDNASTDDTRVYLSTLSAIYNNVVVIENHHNYGISFGYNQGFMESVAIGAVYTVFCNNDLHFFNDGWLDKLVDTMKSDKSLAVVAPLRTSEYDYYSSGLTTKQKLSSIKECSSPEEELSEFMGCKPELTFLRDIANANIAAYGTKLRYIKFPNAISTCICMIRTKIFKDEFGYFDNPYFLDYGGDDIDMTWRILSVGYNCAIINTTYIHHFRNKSLVENVLNRDMLLLKSNRKLIKLWGSAISKFINESGLSDYDLMNNKDYWIIRDIMRINGKEAVLCKQK